MLLEGGCHCRRVRFTVEVVERRLLDCSCSICVMKGILHLIVDETALRCDKMSELSTYTFGTHTAKHHFCRTCGMHPFYRPRSHPTSWDVNARCLDNFVASDWVIEPFDGANWEANIDRIR